MHEGTPKLERVPSADIRHAFQQILQPVDGENGRIDRRDIGVFEIDRSVDFVGWKRSVPKTTYSLFKNTGVASESVHFVYQCIGLDRTLFIDGGRVNLEDGEIILQEEINRALELYLSQQSEVVDDSPTK
jgi:hypothetical protein